MNRKAKTYIRYIGLKETIPRYTHCWELRHLKEM